MKKYTNNVVLLASLELLASEGDEDKSRDAAADLYAEALSEDRCFLDNLFAFVVKFLETLDRENLQELKVFFRFMELFSSSYMKSPKILAENRCTYKGIEGHEEALLKVLKRRMEEDDIVLFLDKFDREQMFSESLADVLGLFFYYISYREDEKRDKVALLVPRFYERFPHTSSCLLLTYIEHHPQAVQTYAKMMICASEQSVSVGGYIGAESLIRDILSPNSSRDDFERKNGIKILKEVLPSYNQWSLEVKDSFIVSLVFEPLKLVYKSQEAVKESVSKYDRHKHLLETDFEAYKEAKLDKAISNGTKSIAKILGFIAGHFREHSFEATVNTLVEKANIKKDVPKIYDMKMKPSIKFKDFTMKLMVIDALMYEESHIKPPFYLGQFAQECKREIDVQADGYEIIPEVQKYYKNLDITQALLDKVHTLHYGYVYCNDLGTYENMWPNFDAGCDQMLEVSLKAVKDLELLPNLKKIKGDNFEDLFDEAFLEALQKRGIVLEDTGY